MEYGVSHMDASWAQGMCKCKEKAKTARKEGKKDAQWADACSVHLQNVHLPIFYCPIICRNHWHCVAASQEPLLQTQICEIYGRVKTMQCLLWSRLISGKLEMSFAHIMQIEF